MRYSKFRITNYKGIESLTLDLAKSPKSDIITLVGLNESGKTTILEALSFFHSKQEIHEESQAYGSISDDSELVPMDKKDNFNGRTTVEATILLNEGEINSIINKAASLDVKLDPESINNPFTISRYVDFKNSEIHKSGTEWSIGLQGKTGKQRKSRSLHKHNNIVWNELIKHARSFLSPILYFPTFLFNLPKRIYIDLESNSQKDAYYKALVQDVLDSLGRGLLLDEHVADRIGEKGLFGSTTRSLDSALSKMGSKITQVVFGKWNEIFNRKITDKRVRVEHGIDSKGKFLSFLIEDGDSKYLITERSLGFRWFFCFLLFTEFRSHRQTEAGALFLLDEPASNLHSKAQAQLLNSFQGIADSGNTIIYSTHSQYLINPHWLESAHIVSNSGIDYDDDESSYSFVARNTSITISRYRDFVGQNPDKETYFQPILDTLDYSPPAIASGARAVMVEGKNDFYLLRYFDKIILSNDSYISVLPGSSAHALDPLISLYLGWGQNFLIFLDDDKAGRSQKERYIREWLIDEDRVLTYSDFDSKWSGFKAEDMFSKRDTDRLKKIMGKSPRTRLKKREIARLIQEKLAAGDSISFDATTKRRFEKLIKGLKEAL